MLPEADSVDHKPLSVERLLKNKITVKEIR